MTFMRYLLFALLLNTLSGHSQTFIQGKLIDEQTNKTIQDANIILKGTTSGTISKNDGSFRIESKETDLSVVISHISYGIHEREISANQNNIIELERALYEINTINLSLGEYNGPAEYIPFDSIEFQNKQNERISRYNQTTFSIVEENAEFFGGMENLTAYFATSFKYPEKVLSKDLWGNAFVLFDITGDGTTDNIEIRMVDDYKKLVTKELIKNTQEMPLWHPAYQRNKPVTVSFVVKIIYAANGYAK